MAVGYGVFCDQTSGSSQQVVMSSYYNLTGANLIIAPHVSSPLPVDDLDSSIWDDVEPIGITHYWSGNEAPEQKYAGAQVCWSEEALHVRFVCNQHEPLVVSSNPITDEKTIGLWERDVCEIFLAPDPVNPNRYFEFEAAPTGEWVDLGILITTSGKETDWDFQSGMSVAARVQQGRVTIGMRIPWSEKIPKPQCGAKWSVNLFRCVGPESEQRYLAWQPTETSQPNFHVPEAFGSLRFT
jgi:hypothetical protein